MRNAQAIAIHGLWLPYGGSARLGLGLVLLAIAVGMVVLGLRLSLPVRLPRPSRRAALALFVVWACAIPGLLVCVSIYVQRFRNAHLHASHVSDPILPFTLAFAAVTLLVILVLHPDESGNRLLSAVIGAIAGPMIFELPFDVIIISRVYPRIPPDPALYLAIFFAPLFVIEITTLSFLLLSPMVRLATSTFFALALMMAVFAGWALAEGFAYPYNPGAVAFNVVSKLLAFVVVLTMFVPQRARPAQRAPVPAGAVGPSML